MQMIKLKQNVAWQAIWPADQEQNVDMQLPTTHTHTHHNFHTFGDIEIEEITVKDSLDTSGNHGYQVEESLGVIAVDPVQYVQRSVTAESKEIVARNCLRLASLADHEQLRQDRDRLQVD